VKILIDFAKADPGITAALVLLAAVTLVGTLVTVL
jgi:hypothetical protein